MPIIEAWLASLWDALGQETLQVREVVVGVFYTAVRLSTGEIGVAFTPRGMTETLCCPKLAASAPPAGRLSGQNSWELAKEALAPSPLRRCVGVAVLNALSARAFSRFGVPDGKLLPATDALEAAKVTRKDRVAMVGAFIPFLRVLKNSVAALWVIDRHPEALRDDEKAFWFPPERAGEVLSQATVVLITGSALVEGGLDESLEASRPAKRRVIAGPTTPLWAPPFFDRGVDVLAGLYIRDKGEMMRLVKEGGSGYHFQTVAEKVCLVRASSFPP